MAEKACVATVLNDNFVQGFVVLIRSMLKHNPWFDFPIKVFFTAKTSYLSSDYRDYLFQHYKNLEFIEVDETKYQNVAKLRDRSLHTPKRLFAAFFILEAFTLSDYDRVVCLDSDMICLGDISELFTRQFDFGICQAVDGARKKLPYCNTGVFVIGKKHLNPKTYNELLGISTNKIASKQYNTACGKADQALINQYFDWNEIQWLDTIYNYNKRIYSDQRLGSRSIADWLKEDDVRFLHYVGEKPWNDKIDPKEFHYSQVEKVWTDYFGEIISPLERSYLSQRNREYEIEVYRYRLAEMQNSYSYRLGYTLLQPPRLMQKTVRYLRRKVLSHD